MVTREAGLPVRASAVAREEYINQVRDVVFPQLRATFGAQFTKAEGDALVSTMGDPNLSPPEKTAVLKTFIDNKSRNINSLHMQANSPMIQPSSSIPQPIGADQVEQAMSALQNNSGITGIAKPQGAQGWSTTPSGTKYRIVQ